MSDEKQQANVQVPSNDPPKDPREDYQASERNKDLKPPTDEKVVEISEEDLKLKENLELLVSRVQDTASTPEVQRDSLNGIVKEIRSATASMTSVPKPLKFLRPHYAPLKAFFETFPASDNKTLLSDVLSVLAMTLATDGSRESLRYRLLGSKGDLANWGHEYIRNLTGEVTDEYEARSEAGTPVLDLMELIHQIVDFNLAHNAEVDACDLLMEVEQLELLAPRVPADAAERIGAYLTKCTAYAADAAEAESLLGTAYQVYAGAGHHLEALRVAMRMDSTERVQAALESCTDPLKRKQMALILGSQRFGIEQSDEELTPLIGNTLLNEHFLALARDLDVVEAKTPEDIYKTHLADGSRSRARAPPAAGAKPSQGVDSAKQNLAASFVNAFVNAGFGKDLLLTVDDGSEWLFKNKDHGILSAAASLGLIMLWDVENGYTAIDKYIHAKNPYIQAGAVLATGLLSTNVTSEMDAGIALLTDYLTNENKDVRLAAIVGLGLAYANSAREDVLSLLNPLVVDTSITIELSAFAALSLGLVYAGTGNDDVCGNIIQAFIDRSATELSDSAARYLCLALGLLFMGRGDMCEAVLETLTVVEHPVMQFCKLVVESCAFAGSGSVLQVQKLLAVCGEHIEDETKSSHQGAAVLGLAAIALGEDTGSEMLLRALDNLLQYGELPVRRAVPLAYALLSLSQPRATVVDTLSKLSHDADMEVSQNAILALGLCGAGTNQSRVAGLLRQLAVYYAKEPNHLFLVRISQGLLHMGKGLMTLSPFHSDRLLVHKPAMAALLVTFFGALDLQHNLLGNRHWTLYYLAAAMRPRMLRTLDAETLKPVAVQVRVGAAVDTVGQAGKPKTITGFQTHSTPVLLAHGQRAELANDEYLSMTPVLEGFVLVKKNPEAGINDKQ